MQGSNLDINIAVNADKARGDIKLLELQIQNLSRLARSALRKDDATGAAAYTQQIGKLQTTLLGLNRTFASTGDAARATGSVFDQLSNKSTRRLIAQFSSLEAGAANIAGLLGRMAGGFTGGLFATAAVIGITKLVQSLDEVTERLTKLRQLARETGLPPAAIEAARKLATARGESAEDADKMMTKTAEAFEKFKAAAGKPVNTQGVKDLTVRTGEAGDAAKEATSQFDRGVQVQRGSSKVIFDAAKGYETLGVNLDNYKSNQEGLLQSQRDIRLAFIDFAQKARLSASQLNALSKELFNVPKDTALALIPGQLADIATKMKQLGDIQARIDAVTAMNVQKDRVNEMFTFLLDKGSDWRVAMATAANKWLADTVDSFNGFWPKLQADFQSSWQTMWTNMARNMPDWLEPTKQAFSDLLQWMESAATATAAAIARAFAAARAAFGSAGAGLPTDPNIAAPMAAGGAVRGPGSGTSDSILARLSNGEFVMKARAVEHWGPRFMAALNAMQNPFGYNAGGLVRPRFAAGGMVRATTSHGVTVNLAFPGGSFALQGDNAIVAGLTREAQRAGMLQGGRKAGVLQ